MSVKVENIEIALKEHFNEKIVSNGFWATYAQIASEFSNQLVKRLDELGYFFSGNEYPLSTQINTSPIVYGGNVYSYFNSGEQDLWVKYCNAKFYTGKHAYLFPCYSTQFNGMPGTTGSGIDNGLKPVGSDYFTVVPIVSKVSELPN